ncbi:MAG: hypothetical protein ABJ311_06480 [Erythrobacter sp.]
MEWVHLKSDLLAATGLTNELAHVYLAVAIQLFIAWSTRLSVASAKPLAVVLALELVNEWFDVRHVGGFDAMQGHHWEGAIWDVVHTMAIPVLLFVLSRWAPDLLVREKAQLPGENAQESGDEPPD